MIVKLSGLDSKQMSALHEALESKDNKLKGGYYVNLISSKGEESTGAVGAVPDYSVKLRVLESDDARHTVPLSKLSRVLQAIGLYPEVKQSEVE